MWWQYSVEGGEHTWKFMEMGGRLHAFLSRVVAISSTLAISECSVAPLKRLIFHTSACFFESYLAFPAANHNTPLHLVNLTTSPSRQPGACNMRLQVIKPRAVQECIRKKKEDGCTSFQLSRADQ